MKFYHVNPSVSLILLLKSPCGGQRSYPNQNKWLSRFLCISLMLHHLLAALLFLFLLLFAVCVAAHYRPLWISGLGSCYQHECASTPLVKPLICSSARGPQGAFNLLLMQTKPFLLLHIKLRVSNSRPAGGFYCEAATGTKREVT